MQTVVENIKIDEEFRDLLPSLDKQTFELLETNLLENGCRDSLVVWGDILIDGHNRYAICTEHDIPFTTISKEFDSREEAMIWIITTQVARRNLNATQLSRYRGLHYETEKKITNDSNQYTVDSARGQNVLDQNSVNSTAKRIAKLYNINEKTVRRDAKIAKATERIGSISPEAKRLIVSEEVKLNKNVLASLSDAPVSKLAEIAGQIENGTFENPKPEPKAPDTQNQGAQDALTGPGGPAIPGGPAGSERPDVAAHPGAPLSDAIIRFVANGVYTELREHSRNDTQVLRASLRSCIDILERLYKGLSLQIA